MEDTKTTQGTETTNIESSAVESTTIETNANVDTEETKTEEKISMTQDELNKMTQKRLEREKKKAEEEKLEAEKLAKMSAEEKAKHDFEKEKAKFEEERKQYQREKMELEIVKQLNVKNLPVEFSRYLLNLDAETSLNNINEFEKVWQTAIEKAVNEKLKGNTPKTSTGNVYNSITKEEFMKMDFFAQQKFANENPEQYKQFIR